MPITEQGKEAALAALQKRRENKPRHIDNSDLPAGAPMYFYCITCGHSSDCLPESYIGTPKRLCGECQALKDLGWLE